jgi:iron complex outermembrane receptor protein
VFHSRFNNFIALSGTGINRDEDGLINPGGELPEFVYRAVPAKFSGCRGAGPSAAVPMCRRTAPRHAGGHAVRASNRDTGEPLPRIAPMRGTAALNWHRDALQLRLEAQGARQDRIAPTAMARRRRATHW